MRTRSIVAAAAIVAFGASGAAAQTADDLAALFPAALWVAQTPDDRVVGCIAAFGGDEGPHGYDIRLNNGTRHGELRFNWQGEDQVVAYDLEFNDGGTRANQVSVHWADGFRSAGSLSLTEAAQRFAEEPLAVAVLQFVWAADFCASAVDLAEIFPPDGWTTVLVAAPLNGIFTCVAIFGPAEDRRRSGYHFATGDGAFGGTLTFVDDENARWTLSYRREADVAGGRITASIRGGGGNFMTILGGTFFNPPTVGTDIPEEMRLRIQARFGFNRDMIQALSAYLENTTFCR